MCLATHIDGYRRIWMFPRNIRSIMPWKMAQISSLFKIIASYDEWSGNQQLQDGLCKMLEDAGLKASGYQYDLHSGGPRTYKAQLECLGIVFTQDSKMFLTQLGDELADGAAPMPIIQELLLRMQYPSTYGSNQNVKVNPELKVKPFLFILELLLDGEIKTLTNEEFMIPVIYGHNRSCLKLCKDKILKMRAGADIGDLIDSENDIYLLRSKKPFENIRDIANTCKNYILASCLVVQNIEEGLQTITVNDSFIDLIRKHLSTADEFIDFGDKVTFQRRFGAKNIKDTRNLQKTAEKSDPLKHLILSKYYEYCGSHITSGFPYELADSLYSSFGIQREKTIDTLTPYLVNSLDFFESTFLSLSIGGTSTANEFEKAACEIFNKKLKFNASHTGQKKRPYGKVGGYSDIFLIENSSLYCAIIDTKASPSYSLPSDDHAKMISNYIPNYTELVDSEIELAFASYIAGGYKGNIESKLHSIKEETKINCSFISAFELLELAKKCEKNYDPKKLRSIFNKTGIIHASDYDAA